MKEFYRVLLGEGHCNAQECREQGFISAGFGIRVDLTNALPEDKREFNKQFIPAWMDANPGKSKIAAGQCCGFLWTICKGIQEGDIILSPDGKGKYFAGKVTSDYRYVTGHEHSHRRQVHWFDSVVDRSDMSEELKRGCGGQGTVRQISKYREELEDLITGTATKSVLIVADEIVEDPVVFALEKHLEDFLVANWSQTLLGKDYDVYQEEDNFGQQYQTDTGSIDILAVRKDRQELLVVELKKGRASDAVVGQILRYMGYIKEVIAEDCQTVSGVIIALEDDLRIRRALKVVPNIDFYRYEVKFDLIKS